MKKTFTLYIFTLLICNSICGQIDQVSVGASYSQQAYYTLSNGAVHNIENEAWDIAFSAIGGQDAGIFINESASFSSSPIQLFLANISDWNETISDIESYTEDLSLYNPEIVSSEGAFNTVKDINSPFDYGWGAYNPQTHIIEGSNIFIIKKRDGSFIKLQVVSLINGVYSFKWADLDGSNEKTADISKDDATNGMLHFSFEDETIIELPEDYDLIFQRYSTPLDAGDGSFIDYTVTGVLLANGTEAVLVDDIDPVTAVAYDYADEYSSLPTTIGHEWKSFDFASGWVIDENRTHFIKTKDGEIYQLTFYDFEGSSTGITTLERSFVSTVSTEDELKTEVNLTVFPNPTSDYFTIQSESPNLLNITITNTSGQTVKRIQQASNETIDISTLTPGLYYVTIGNSEFTKIRSLVVR